MIQRNLQNRNRLRDLENELIVVRGRVGGRDSWGVWVLHVYISVLKMDNQQGPTVSTGNSAQCYMAAWMGGEFGGERIHVSAWMRPFSIYLRLSQHC